MKAQAEEAACAAESALGVERARVHPSFWTIFQWKAQAHVYKKPDLCVIVAQNRPIVANFALPRGGALTGDWLIAFISGLVLRQNIRFLVAKMRKSAAR